MRQNENDCVLESKSSWLFELNGFAWKSFATYALPLLGFGNLNLQSNVNESVQNVSKTSDLEEIYGQVPTTKMTHGDKNIEAHHRRQVPVKNGGILDELEQRTHRGGGNHTRHDKPTQLTPSQRAKEIREHYKERGKEYILPGEGI